MDSANFDELTLNSVNHSTVLNKKFANNEFLFSPFNRSNNLFDTIYLASITGVALIILHKHIFSN